jgi:hypothetical protein
LRVPAFVAIALIAGDSNKGDRKGSPLQKRLPE